MDIRHLADDQLREELERRKAKTLPEPKPLPRPDMAPVVAMAIEGHEQTVKDGYEDEDLQHHVYEAVMTAVFGIEYWPWQRQHRR